MSAPAPNPNVRGLLARLTGRVPTRPGPMLDLLGAPDDPAEIAEIIERDPAMSARVLGVCNSAGGGAAAGVHSVSRAVLHLGAARARFLGLAFATQLAAEKLALPKPLLDLYWRSSIRKAEAAHLLADHLQVGSKNEAYAAGLVQDLGLPVLMAEDPGFYEQDIPLRPAHLSWSEAEMQRFGVDHAMVGGALLRQWGVAEPTVRLVERSHESILLNQPAERLVPNLPAAIAALLPHDQEEAMPPADLEPLVTVFSMFLQAHYKKPDDFIAAIDRGAAERLNRPSDSAAEASPPAIQPYLEAITRHSVELVHELWQIQDRAARHEANYQQLETQAYTDPLTSVLNRRGFFHLAKQRLARAEQQVPVCLMVLDVNKFKDINDTHGHSAGDAVLQQVAKSLRQAVRRGDMVARFGGDEFVVFLIDLPEEAARNRAQRITDACLKRPWRISAGLELPAGLSFGAAYTPGFSEHHSFEALIQVADDAMYMCKRSGQPGLSFTQASASPPLRQAS